MAPTTSEERFSHALHSAARVWRVALDARLKHLGVSQAGWMTIATIAKSDTPPSQSELAAQLSIEGPTMVAMIDRLVKAGFVERVASQTDRRVKHVTLTPAGEGIYAQVRSKASDFRNELLGQFDAETIRTVTACLEKIQSLIENS